MYDGIFYNCIYINILYSYTNIQYALISKTLKYSIYMYYNYVDKKKIHLVNFNINVKRSFGNHHKGLLLVKVYCTCNMLFILRPLGTGQFFR